MTRRIRLTALLFAFWLSLSGQHALAQPADPAEQEARGALQQAQTEKDWPRTQHYLDVLLKRHPRNVTLLGQKGDALNAMGKSEEALAIFRQRTELSPKDASAWNDLCWQLMFARGPQKARPACQRSVAIHKRYDNTANLGHTYLLTADSQTAYRWYRESIKLQEHDGNLFAPKGPIAAFDQFIKNGWLTNDSRRARAWMLRHFNESQEVEALKKQATSLAQQIDKQPGFYPGAVVNRQSQTYLQENEKVIALLEKALDIAKKRRGPHHPQTLDILNALADRHAVAGNYPKAEKILQAMLARSKKQYGMNHPQTAEALTRLVLLHLEARQYQKARPLTKQLIAIAEETYGREHPKTLEQMERAATYYQAAGEIENELALRRRILTLSEKIDQPSGENLMRLALLQGQANSEAQALRSRTQSNTDSASPSVSGRIVSDAETAARAALRTAWQAKDWPQALQQVNALIALHPDDGTLIRWKSHFLSQLGKTEESIATYRRSTELTPNNDDAWNGLCWQLILAQRLPEARAACERSVALKKNFANTVNLGHTYLLAGDATAAYRHYRDTVALLKSEKDLIAGPLNDFDTFIRNGWQRPESQQAREWFVREYAEREHSAPPVQGQPR